MKKLFTPAIFFFCFLAAQSQNVAINNDGSSAATSAMLEVKSTTKGFMMPRVTSAQRGAIASPVLGLLVFDTDTKTIWTYNGASWSNLTSAGGGGSLTLPFNQTVNEAGTAFKITNTSGAIQGVSSNISTAALSGSNNSTGGMGVIGSSSAATGIGVSGQSSVGTGVFGLSSDGVGVKATSTNGVALQVNGNVKISGGNTNPSNGAVLTSDANGNAVWKPNRIGFQALTINTSYDDLQSDKWYKIIFASEFYDFTNNFTPYAGNSQPPPIDASTFTVPVDGVYHFDSHFELHVAGQSPSEVSGQIRLVVNRNGNILNIESLPAVEKEEQAFLGYTIISFKLSLDYFLFPGDKVYLEIRHSNADLAHALFNDQYNTRFSGRLAIPY